MLGQMADEHVPPSAGQPRPSDGLGGERRRETTVEPFEFRDTLDHLAVTRRVRTPSGDDVAAVFTVFACSAEEL
jgi:hypothetical protein